MGMHNAPQAEIEFKAALDIFTADLQDSRRDKPSLRTLDSDGSHKERQHSMGKSTLATKQVGKRRPNCIGSFRMLCRRMATLRP